MIVFVCLLVICFLVGQVLNGLSIFVLLKHQNLKSVSNCYQLSLSICMMLAISLSASVQPLRMIDRQIYWQNSFIRAIESVGEKFFLYCAVLNLTAQDFERYIGLSRPLKSKTGTSLNRTKKIIGFLWLVSAIAAVPTFICEFNSINKNQVTPQVESILTLSTYPTSLTAKTKNNSQSDIHCNKDSMLVWVCQQRAFLSPILCFILLFCLPLLSNIFLFISIIRRLRQSVCLNGDCRGSRYIRSRCSSRDAESRSSAEQSLRRRRFGTVRRRSNIHGEQLPRISIALPSESSMWNTDRGCQPKQLAPTTDACTERHSFSVFSKKSESVFSELHATTCSEENIGSLTSALSPTSFTKQHHKTKKVFHITGAQSRENLTTGSAELKVVHEKRHSLSDGAMYVRASTPTQSRRYGKRSTSKYSSAVVYRNTPHKSSTVDRHSRRRRLTEIATPPAMKRSISGSYVVTRSQSEQRVNVARSLRNYCYTTVFPDAAYEMKKSNSACNQNDRESRSKTDRRIITTQAEMNPRRWNSSSFSRNTSMTGISEKVEFAPTWLWRVRMRAVKNLAIGIAVYVMHWLPLHIVAMQASKEYRHLIPKCTCCYVTISELEHYIIEFWMCFIAVSTPLLHCVCSKKFRIVYITLLKGAGKICPLITRFTDRIE